MVQTRFGTLFIGDTEEVFEKLALQLLEVHRLADDGALVALTGGSTPKAFYQWVIENERLDREIAREIDWTTSDERWVPLDSPESNFGEASRLLLDPLGVPVHRRIPWTTVGDPEAAAREMDGFLRGRLRDETAIDLCILGMGDDAHTLSLFPGSPLVDQQESGDRLCAAIDVPGKGQRLTYTPQALAVSGWVVVVVTGAKKAPALRSVFHEDHDAVEEPVRIVAANSERVLWLMDHEAAKSL